MSKTPVSYEFSHPVEVAQLGPEGIIVRLEAAEPIRKALAKRFNILAVLSLKAELRLAATAESGHYLLKGLLTAEVEQSCVVSLEPVREQIEAPFERGFAPAEIVAALLAEQPELTEEEAELIDPDSPDLPDPIQGGVVDLGEVVAEELALSLDPYPRKPGAQFPAGYVPDPEPEAKVSPFAVLAQLKKGTEK